jgi:hypothetical protein
MIAYHFISEKYALDVISNQCLKLSLINDLNDPFELIAADLPDFESRREARKFKDHMAGKFGILCFSKKWNNPLLWSHYANRHKGVALEFIIKDEKALPVKYRKNRFGINFKEKVYLKQSVSRVEVEGLWLTKFDSWSYEEEVRVICSQADCIRRHNLLFHPLNDEISLKGVILGPLCEFKVEDLKEKLPVGMELGVIKSRLAFRSFNIVKQKRFKKLKLKKLKI